MTVDLSTLTTTVKKHLLIDLYNIFLTTLKPTQQPTLFHNHQNILNRNLHHHFLWPSNLIIRMNWLNNYLIHLWVKCKLYSNHFHFTLRLINYVWWLDLETAQPRHIHQEIGILLGQSQHNLGKDHFTLDNLIANLVSPSAIENESFSVYSLRVSLAKHLGCFG